MFDAEAGWFYNTNRDYNPALGRYVQSDPIGLAGGSVSPYVYVDNGPLSLIDDLGLKKSKFPHDSVHCVALRDKIASKNAKLDKRWDEYILDPQNLPERVCPTEQLAESRRGHRTLINWEDTTLRKLEKRYREECEDPPDDPPNARAPATPAGAPGSDNFPEPPTPVIVAAPIILGGLLITPEVTIPALPRLGRLAPILVGQ